MEPFQALREIQARFRLPSKKDQSEPSGEILSLGQFCNRIRYYVKKGSVFRLCVACHPCKLVGNYEFYDSLFSFLANNLDVAEDIANRGLATLPDSWSDSVLLRQVLEAIDAIRRSGLGFDDFGPAIHNAPFENKVMSSGNELSNAAKQALRKRKTVVETIQSFARIFGREEDVACLCEDATTLAKRIDQTAKNLLRWINPDYVAIESEVRAKYIERGSETIRKHFGIQEDDPEFQKLLDQRLRIAEQDHYFSHEATKTINDAFDLGWNRLLDLLQLSGTTFFNEKDPHKRAAFLSPSLYKVLSLLQKKARVLPEAGVLSSVFDWCSELLKKSAYEELKPEEKKRVNDFYYLSIYYGGFSQTLVSYGSWSRVTYDFYSGFSACETILEDQVSDAVQRWRLTSEKTTGNILRGTRIKDLKLLETSYYLRPFQEFSPLFAGMEYTPILVNLFKSVEIFICDLIKKLGLEQATTSGYRPLAIRRATGESVELSNPEWEDQVTLGDLCHFLDWLNKATVRVYDASGREITQRIHGYAKAFEDKQAAKALKLSVGWLEKDNDLHFASTHANPFSPSDLFKEILSTWTSQCRNANLHKHVTIDDRKQGLDAQQKLDFCFEFTAFVMATLMDWYEIVS
ncbi:MAG: hypothetical protein K6E59_01130 [Bacilli bacterium]|nr:hypothetical protein [Bacilli bacterium]